MPQHDTAPYNLPSYLAERVRPFNQNTINGSGAFVLYWMHHAVRVEDNPALDVACLIAHEINCPLLVYQGLAGRHKYNSDRHHTFIMQGAQDVQRQLHARGIRYAFYLAHNASHKSPLYTLALNASVVVTEDFPAPPFPGWIQQLAKAIEAPLWAVDTHCILPMQLAKKSYNRAYTFREAFEEEMLNRIDQPWPMLHDRPPFADFDLPFTSVSFEDVEIADLCASCDIDHSVGPVHHTKGGAVEGYKRWDLFKTHGLSSYHKLRNDPTVRFPQRGKPVVCIPTPRARFSLPHCTRSSTG